MGYLRILFFIIIVEILFFNVASSEVKINEFAASNSESHYDENMGASDWVELYNSGPEDVKLANYRISDKDDYDSAWIIPDTIIKSEGYLTIFVSGKDRRGSKNYILESSGKGLPEFYHKDGYRFQYIEVAGDFDISVRFHSLRDAFFYTSALLMTREELDEDSRYAAMACQNQKRGGYLFYHRDNKGENTKSVFFYNRKIEYPNARIRLKREADSVFGYIYDEGWTWYSQNSKVYLPVKQDTIYLGVALASSDNNRLSKLTFSDLILNGDTLSAKDLKSIEIETGVEGKFYISNELHTDFSLKRSGESIFLWDASGILIDSVHFGEQTTDVSYGRMPDGADSFLYFQPPTPDAENDGGYKGVAAIPEFSNEGGWFDTSQNVNFLNTDNEIKIYYTKDGSEPDKTSLEYRGSSIRIDTTTVIRAKTFKNNYLESPIITNSYFIGDSSPLQVISLAADPYDLWNKENGIFVYENLNSKKEIPVNFELWDSSGQQLFEARAGAKTHGQLSRTFPQKSMRLYAKSKYGRDMFEYPFFGERGMEQYKRIILRNGGTEWKRSILRDGFSAVVAEGMPNLDAMAFSPSLMFMNGTYYGIQNIRERIDETYISMKYDIPIETIKLLEDWDKLLYGDAKGYHLMYDSLMQYDMDDISAYEFLDRNIDLDNITEYVVLEMYMANIDWIWKNLKYWQSAAYDGRWRWVLNDMDYTCGVASWPEFDMMKFATDNSWIFSQMFPKILENEKYRIKFINRSADLVNTTLLAEDLISILDSLADILRPAIPRQNAHYDSAAVEWEHEIDVMRGFLKRRKQYFPAHYVEYFGLSDTSSVSLNVYPLGSGKIRINTIIPDKYPWRGVYFLDIPVEIQAIPNKGYSFSSWSDNSFESGSVTTLLTNYFNLTAYFEKADLDTNIVINEIMYKNSQVMDSDDWAELYNAGIKDIDISGWILKDGNDDHIFIIPDNTILEADSYLVLCQNKEKYSNSYPQISNYAGDFDFGLGVEDMVRLYDKNGEIIDSVNYSYQNPWPRNSNGTGYSIELKDPEYDNSIADNWQSSTVKSGTPGEINSVKSEIEITSENNKYRMRAYPNPFDENCNIEMSINENQTMNLDLYDGMGKLIKPIIREKVFNTGTHNINLSAAGLSPGAYFVKAECNEYTQIVPVILIK